MNFETKSNYNTDGEKTMSLVLTNMTGAVELLPSEIPVLLAVLKDVNGTVKANSK